MESTHQDKLKIQHKENNDIKYSKNMTYNICIRNKH